MRTKVILILGAMVLSSGIVFAQTGKTYTDSRGQEIFFPFGERSFADEVVSFEEGNPSAWPKYSQPEQAIGIPNYPPGILNQDPEIILKWHSKTSVSLGCGGTLVLRFVDNALVDIPGPDLYVFETGRLVEPVALSISRDGRNWANIGQISGATAAVDISNFVRPDEELYFVRLTDLRSACISPALGADIDAVGAIGSISRGRGSLKVVATGGPIPGVTAPSKIELILDASGSMKGKMGDSTKIRVAKDVLKEIIENLPGGLEVGLRVYGHRYSNKLKDKSRSCRDSQLVYRFSKINKQALLAKIEEITPRGWTPIGYSLSQLEKDFRGVEGEKVAILVSDGKETCDQKKTDPYYPKKVAKGLGAQGVQLIKVKVNVVGFAIADKGTKSQLREIAELTGGRYLDAKDREGLRKALEQFLAAPYDVLDSTGKKVGTGRVGQGMITVPEGIYTVFVHAAGKPITISNIKVANGKSTTVKLKKEGKEIVTRVDGP